MGDHHRSSDEISLFLNQILLRSSSSSTTTTSSCSSFMGVQEQVAVQQESCYYDPRGSNNAVKEGMLGFDGVKNNVGYFFGNAKGNGPSLSSVARGCGGGGASENETTDPECDCESEEGLEALLVEEVQTKAGASSRSSSKRSRAAEVHNLSEKRRRSRINEKMKALQNLIPNSNKTDKASMLDEAIEYLKQLQLQVQMLSMRNGIGLHPMCLPGMLQPIQYPEVSRGFGDENVRSQHPNATGGSGALPLNQQNPEQIVFDLPNHCNHLPMSNNVINSETSFAMESSIRAHFGPFPHRPSSEEIFREGVLPHQGLNADQSEFEMRSTTTTSLPYEEQASNLKDSNSLGACMIRRDQNECLFMKNLDHNLIISSSVPRKRTRSSRDNELKAEIQEI